MASDDGGPADQTCQNRRKLDIGGVRRFRRSRARAKLWLYLALFGSDDETGASPTGSDSETTRGGSGDDRSSEG
ncbi:hypothetical protein [Halorubrum laminariae]|uniref:Uncharacterized protein n=1 Tax=Halorubrum laminariae TaxID=1433523 RepID=A0ABD6BY66_9EURY|nr:hypothetical protein [Halorubrum laminariae]